jgi:hypothetical protein
MRPTSMVFVLVALAALSGCFSSRQAATQREVAMEQQATAQDQPVSIQVFYDQLSPYGAWFEYRPYGYVWKPEVGPGFAPYATSGHWVYTDVGWAWDSDYPWGWAPFHYGRWDFDDRYGWIWVPDTEWGPAWVAWRRAPGFYGWVPLRPHIGYRDAVAAGYMDRDDRWIFVQERDLARADLNRYYLDRSRNPAFIRQSRVIGNTRFDNSRRVTYVAGPEVEEVRRMAPTRIDPVAVQEANRPGSRAADGRFQVYRPRFGRTDANAPAPAPKVVRPPVDNSRAPERAPEVREERPVPVTPPEKTPAVREQRPAPERPPERVQPVPLPAERRPADGERKPEPRVVKPVDKTQPEAPAKVRQPRTPNKEKVKSPPPEKKKEAREAKPAKPAPESKGRVKERGK